MADHQHGSYSTELLDLDGEVLADHLSAVTGWIAGHLGDHPVHHIVDLGAGTGTGTFALLGRFGDAEVTAVDASADMLAHLTHRAKHHGVDHRVTTRQADLDTGHLDTEPADLTWASASMHHMAHPERVLADIRTGLTPGGLFAMIEFETFPRFLPDDFGLGTPGLEERCNALADRMRESQHPTVNSDWGARLAESGFTVHEERTFGIDVPAPLSAVATRYARVTLSRLRQGLGAQLSDDDRTTLDALLAETGPHRLENRTDLVVRSSRRAWIASGQVLA
ncbi:class I SAM-dependent methyltransferase [Kineosporia sp. J2-2]|uniref:Class I SAM-dependent methyltransferase n=1 Tax=Kineosporia corallincola TaxID=2835133 RepID=A0ABS5TGT8_9ACTN|nr:class I SAM-dependent methyltransferase [Kineosporia corallincola]MBT0769288.1 class I SAM-dependent methyltransferase [Kineosporia corallincola]